MIQIDKSIVKVINSFVNKTINGFEIVGIELQKGATLWGEYEMTEERLTKANISIKQEREITLDEAKEIVFQIGDSGRLVCNKDISNIPLSLSIDFKILD
jgi:small nuclear ribonucleoprotein (snRNP)-like protein